MSEYIHKSHNVTVLMYHLVFPAKYRRVVFDEEVDEVLTVVRLPLITAQACYVRQDHQTGSCGATPFNNCTGLLLDPVP